VRWHLLTPDEASVPDDDTVPDV